MTQKIAQARWSQVYAQSKIGGKEVHGVIISYGIRISVVFLITENIYVWNVDSKLHFEYICSIKILRNFEVNSKSVQPYPSTTLLTRTKQVRKSYLALSVLTYPFQNYPKSFDRTSSVPMAMRFWSLKTVLWRFIPSIECGTMVN